ncbi:MAG TPA: TIGR00725 family protein [Acidimicrobiales bacterium]|jgi:hypothetical protein|nr:TIGR00725 family protein [Acidimicrobiales bacterium]
MTSQIAVVGATEATARAEAAAETIGASLASAGVTIICGGLGGVMAGACRGAKTVGGTTVGILPGRDPRAANQWVDVVIPSGLGEARNALVVGAAAVVIAVGGEYGTLSEIALALRAGIPVIGVGTWSLTNPEGKQDSGIIPIGDPHEAAAVAQRLATNAPGMI